MLTGWIVVIGGCGGSGSGADGVKSEAENRFQSFRKLGETNTKQAIKDAKKKAALEKKEKLSIKSVSSKP